MEAVNLPVLTFLFSSVVLPYFQSIFVSTGPISQHDLGQSRALTPAQMRALALRSVLLNGNVFTQNLRNSADTSATGAARSPTSGPFSISGEDPRFGRANMFHELKNQNMMVNNQLRKYKGKDGKRCMVNGVEFFVPIDQNCENVNSVRNSKSSDAVIIHLGKDKTKVSKLSTKSDSNNSLDESDEEDGDSISKKKSRKKKTKSIEDSDDIKSKAKKKKKVKNPKTPESSEEYDDQSKKKKKRKGKNKCGSEAVRKDSEEDDYSDSFNSEEIKQKAKVEKKKKRKKSNGSDETVIHIIQTK